MQFKITFCNAALVSPGGGVQLTENDSALMALLFLNVLICSWHVLSIDIIRESSLLEVSTNLSATWFNIPTQRHLQASGPNDVL